MSVVRPAQATHASGGQLTYTHINTTRYMVKVLLEYDMLSYASQGPVSIELTCKPNGCTPPALGSFRVSLSRQPDLAYYPSLHCNGGGYRHAVVTFEGEVTLPQAQWVLSVTEENRTSNIRNIANSDQRSLYLEATLDNRSFVTNNSARFTAPILPGVRLNTPTTYSFAAFDPDGDSLAYTVV